MKRSERKEEKVEEVSEEEEKELTPEQELMVVMKSPLSVIADAAMMIGDIRVMVQTRITHLKKRGMRCPDTEELLNDIKPFEELVDGKLATKVKSHPAAHWFTRINGTGGERIGKVLGEIDAFGRFYPIGDPLIPPYIKREPISLSDGKSLVWVEAIERFATPSKLRKYAGLSPGQKKEAGKRLSFNEDLRIMLYRLGSGMLRTRARTDCKYADFYYDYKKRLLQRLEQEGVKVMPTPKGRYCFTCQQEVSVKMAHYCPVCGERLGNKEEPPGVKYEGHVHFMCLHRTMQLFLDHLWVVWREAQGLPLRQPYPIEYMGHSTIISPWDMVDR